MFWHRNRKVGIALGGGAARGLAHIGVLEVLEREGIPIHYIAGTSAGAMIGALYAAGANADRLKKQALSLDWVKFASLFDISLISRSGFILGGRVTRLLRTFIGGDLSFQQLKIPFACTAADIMTGEEIDFKEGNVLEAVRASISIPVIFRSVKWQDRFLVDGELVNPIPTDLVKKMGAGVVIAVNVTPDMKVLTSVEKQKHKVVKEPSIFTVAVNALYMHSAMLEQFYLDADVVIRPDVAYIGPSEFLRAREFIELGEQAAIIAMPEIKKKLGIKT